MKYLAVLGRQPEISVAELAAKFEKVCQKSELVAEFETEHAVKVDFLGGTLKVGVKIDGDPLKWLEKQTAHRLTIGLSNYSLKANPKKILLTALKWKNRLKKQGKSVRIVNMAGQAVLPTATAHHNQLGEKPGQIEILQFGEEYYASIGTQNITAYAERDQKRPARDAKNGMLPPKLAQILINLCGNLPIEARILDPFCGSGVVAQEAVLMGLRAYGTDLNPKMVDFSQKNLEWLKTSYLKKRRKTAEKIGEAEFEIGDATKHQWSGEIAAVAAETYLGPPLSNPPANIRLKEIKQECGSVILGFLKNLAPQIKSGTPITLAVPAWQRENGEYESLNLLDEARRLGYNVREELGQSDLLYHRAGQVVAREIILLRKK